MIAVNKIAQKVFYGASLLLALAIPLAKHAVPTVIGLICISWFFRWYLIAEMAKYKKRIKAY